MLVALCECAQSYGFNDTIGQTIGGVNYCLLDPVTCGDAAACAANPSECGDAASCDLKLFVVWTGSDANGNYFRSAGESVGA